MTLRTVAQKQLLAASGGLRLLRERVRFRFRGCRGYLLAPFLVPLAAFFLAGCLILGVQCTRKRIKARGQLEEHLNWYSAENLKGGLGAGAGGGEDCVGILLGDRDECLHDFQVELGS